MKKIVALALVACMLIPALALAEEPAVFTFRNGIAFGMTRDQIVACEGKEPDSVATDGYLYIGESSVELKANVFYGIDAAGALAAILVEYKESHTNPNLYIDDFDKVDEALTAKYSVPMNDEHYIWSNTLFKDDESNYGLAIVAGQLQLFSCWESGDIKIYHTLNGDNFKANHTIAYISPLYNNETNTDGV